MGAPKGNQYYLLRSKNGSEKKYTPSQLITIANKYFNWVQDNPFKEQVVFHHQGNITKTDVTKMRPFSLEGFCNFAEIVVNTFKNYEKLHLIEGLSAKELKEAKDYLTVTTRIRQIIENQQFEGAASGFLNHNIIARKLGLIDKQELQGNPDKPLIFTKRTIVIKERNPDD